MLIAIYDDPETLVPDDDDAEVSECLACGGDAYMMGILGQRVFWRCVDCGAEHSTTFG